MALHGLGGRRVELAARSALGVDVTPAWGTGRRRQNDCWLLSSKRENEKHVFCSHGFALTLDGKTQKLNSEVPLLSPQGPPYGFGLPVVTRAC